MKKRRTNFPTLAVDTAVGYATDERGSGIAYARVRAAAGEHLLRVPFQVARTSALRERRAGYAALTAISQALHDWGVGRVRFALDDAALIDDLTGRRDVPPGIVLPYVRLRCTLNQFDDFTLDGAAVESDLAQRARAEIALNAAA
jgi:hypothetical protein